MENNFKFKIRSNTFETNSSSMHTIVLKNTTDYTTDLEITDILNEEDSPFIVDNGNIYLLISGDSFDQDYEFVDNWYDKLRYVIADAATSINIVKTIESVIKARFSSIPELQNFKGLLFRTNYEHEYYSSFRDYRNNDEISLLYASNNIEFLETGEIDHQSYGTARDTLELINHKDFKKAVFELVFSNRYLIITDSDGGGYFVDGLIKGYYDKNLFKAQLATFYPANKDPNSKDYGHTDYDGKFSYFEDLNTLLASKIYDNDEDDYDEIEVSTGDDE